MQQTLARSVALVLTDLRAHARRGLLQGWLQNVQETSY
jgi:hypothetical protein